MMTSLVRLTSSLKLLGATSQRRMHDSCRTDETQLAILRMFIGGMLFAVIPVVPYGWLDTVPAEFFHPVPGLPQLIHHLPFQIPLTYLDWIIRGLCLALALGIRSRITGTLLGMSLLYGNCFRYSIGKIDHDDILLIITIVSLSWEGRWGRKLALLPDSSRYSAGTWAPSVIALCISAGMFTAGFEKMISWIDWDLSTSGFISWYRYKQNLQSLTFIGRRLALLPAWVHEGLDYLTVIFEMTPLLCLLLSRRIWKCWLIAATIFHLSIYLVLQINFFNQCLTYLTFTCWIFYQSRGQVFLNRSDAKFMIVAAAGICAVAITRMILIRIWGFIPGLPVICLAVVLLIQLRGYWLEWRTMSGPGGQVLGTQECGV
ncbi:MAG: hypothetical protein ACKOU6_19570 [Planctomycetota bacterium]